MSIRLSGFFRCPCAKIHTLSGIGPNSTCSCGRNLYEFYVAIIRGGK